MSKSSKSRDAQLAWQIHNQLNRLDVTGITENAAFPNNSSKENYKPKTLIDNTLEVIDPTPNIHTLFVQFDKRFFSNKLITVEVKWSPRMTSCAGTCTFNTGSRYCVIALSSPLLKLRPRKDLVETLLHEMIHAYLFVTNNNRDRDGHGPEFCKHMHRINKEAGTHITVYHTFHAEVKLYQQHWWRCNGPCQKKHPFFGMVRRAMNRAPGPNDFWWKEHQETCGGQFIKVREPEKVTKGKKTKNEPKKAGLDKWLTPPPNKPKGEFGSNNFKQPKDKTGSAPVKKTGSNNPTKKGGVGLKTKGGSSVLTVNKWNANATSTEPGVKKLGNSTNNVHGFGTGGPGSSNSASSSKSSSGKPVSFSGTLGGAATGQSRLLDMFNSSKSNTQTASKTDKKEESKNKNNPLGPSVKCPICNDLISEKIANEHIDMCLHKTEKKNIHPFIHSTPRSTSKSSENRKDPECPVCKKPFPASSITDHIDSCLESNNDKKFPESHSASGKGKNSEDDVECPVCKKRLSLKSIADHIDFCLESAEKKDSKPSSSSLLNSIETIVLDDSVSEVVLPTKKRKLPDFSNGKESKIPKNNTGKNYNAIDKNEAGPSSVIDINDIEDESAKTNQEKGNKKKTEICLICNKVLDPEIPLTQHLDDCLSNMFDDDTDRALESIDLEEIEKSIDEKKSKTSAAFTKIVDIEDSSSEEETEPLERNNSNRFPCPVCMTLVPQNNMNAHLDSCLG